MLVLSILQGGGYMANVQVGSIHQVDLQLQGLL